MDDLETRISELEKRNKQLTEETMALRLAIEQITSDIEKNSKGIFSCAEGINSLAQAINTHTPQINATGFICKALSTRFADDKQLEGIVWGLAEISKIQGLFSTMTDEDIEATKAILRKLLGRQLSNQIPQ